MSCDSIQTDSEFAELTKQINNDFPPHYLSSPQEFFHIAQIWIHSLIVSLFCLVFFNKKSPKGSLHIVLKLHRSSSSTKTRSKVKPQGRGAGGRTLTSIQPEQGAAKEKKHKLDPIKVPATANNDV